MQNHNQFPSPNQPNQERRFSAPSSIDNQKTEEFTVPKPVDYRGTPQEVKEFRVPEELRREYQATFARYATSKVIEEPKTVPIPIEAPQPVDYRGTPQAAGVFKIPEGIIPPQPNLTPAPVPRRWVPGEPNPNVNRNTGAKIDPSKEWYRLKK